MSKIITFSRHFPAYHPKAGQPTFFVEKLTKSLVESGQIETFDKIERFYEDYYSYETCAPKHHTIRAGNRFKSGEMFSPRFWSNKPYCSPMITIAPDIEVKKVYAFSIIGNQAFYGTHNSPKWAVLQDHTILGEHNIHVLAKNDGLEKIDLLDWFKVKPNKKDFRFEGQIICWSDEVNY